MWQHKRTHHVSETKTFISLWLNSEKHDNLKTNGPLARQQFVQSKNPVPQLGQSSAKSVVKHHYHGRCFGQPGPSNIIFLATLYLEAFDTTQTEWMILPLNFTISKVFIFSNPKTNFVHRISSEVTMSTGLAKQFVLSFFDLSELLKSHANFNPDSLIAHFVT